MTLDEEIEKVDLAEKILRNAGHILRTKRIKQKTCATEGSDRQVSLAINILLTILDTDRDWLLTKSERKIINENLGDVNDKKEDKEEKGD